MLTYFEINCENKTFNLIFDDTIPIPHGKFKSSYVYFCIQNRKIINDTFGNQLTFGNQARILQFCWLNISDEFKNYFNV